MSVVGKQKKKRYVALFDFAETSMPGQPGPLLAFKRGDFMLRTERVETTERVWFFGTLVDGNGKSGWFPSSLVERSRPARGSSSGSQMLGSSASVNVLSPPSNKDKGSFSPRASSPAASSLTSSSTSSPPQSPSPKPPTVLEVIKVVRATHDYTPTEQGQLALCQNELLGVVAELGGGQFFDGINMGGMRGRFPSNRVSVVHSSGPGRVLGRAYPDSFSSSSGPKPLATVRTTASSRRLLDAANVDTSARNKIVREIVQTEQAYGAHLDEICVSYKEPMEKVPGEWKKQIPILFQNIDTIRALSHRLQAALNQMVQFWKPTTSSVAQCFLDLGPFFVYYEEYCRGFEAAQKCLDAHMTDPAFVNFLKASKAELPLPALLVMPVQRMPRYKLLLEDLVRHTSDSHPDYAPLKDAVTMVSVLATEINEKIRSSEKTQSLLEEGREKERLARFVTRERTVLLSCKDATIKIDQCKSMVGKLKGEVFIMTDSLLILLKRTVKTDVYGWVDDFSHIFWPTRLLWIKKGTLSSISIGGPLFGVTIKLKKNFSQFADLLVAESAKHRSGGSDDKRVGVYSFNEAGMRYDGEWAGSTGGAFMDGKGAITLGLGVVYSGQFKNNEITGNGKMKISSGDVLIGNFEKGLLHGDGIIEYANGDSFKGKFVQGVRQGTGEFRSPTMSYIGEWASDNASGKGKLTIGASTSYLGVFEDGVFVQGEYQAPDGTVYSGTFLNFDFLDGQGSARFTDGSKFTGVWKCGIKEGEGRQEFADGSVLNALWKHDLPNGNGNWSGGPSQWVKSYTGTFVDGKMHGKTGEVTFADGSKFKGSFKDGMIDKGELTCADGSVISGKFRNGRLVGKGSYNLTELDDFYDGAVDAANRLPAKTRYLPVQLPFARPSFPLSIAFAAIKK